MNDNLRAILYTAAWGPLMKDLTFSSPPIAWARQRDTPKANGWPMLIER